MNKIMLLEHPRVLYSDRQNDIANTTLSSCLNSGYLAAILLEHKYMVYLTDGYSEHLSYEQIEDKIKENKPDVLAVHLVYNWENNENLYKFLLEVKDKYNIYHVTLYGYYPTFAYEEILTKCLAADTCMLGENELTILSLMQNLSDFSRVKGIAYRAENGFVASKGEIVKDLDSLPFPIRKPSSYPEGEVNIFGSRGCYGNCTFCYINPFLGVNESNCLRWRGRSPENIIAEIDEIIAGTDYRYFYFTDPNFFGPGKEGKERVLHLAKLLKERNITFGIEARANDIEPETTKALVEAGLKNILVGLESGKDSSLKRLNKFTTVLDNENALKVLRSCGIEPYVGFIMFEPDSTIEDLRINFEFLKRNKLLRKLEFSVNVLYHHMIILAGTKSYKELQKAGRLKISDHSVYEAYTDYLNPNIKTMAKIMRDITNYIFDYIKPTWRLSEDGESQVTSCYDKINDILVNSFVNALDMLSKNDISDDKRDEFVFGVCERIKEVGKEMG